MTSTHAGSDRNVAVVQRLYEAFAQRDIPAIISALDPEVVWGEPENPFNPAAGTRFGHEGFLEWLKIGQASEDIVALEVRQFLSGEDCVAAVGNTRCVAKATGKTYETDFVHLVTLKNGRIIGFQEFFDTFAAAEAFRT
jgi:ketosteroid isomerase-like protein